MSDGLSDFASSVERVFTFQILMKAGFRPAVRRRETQFTISDVIHTDFLDYYNVL